MLCIKYQHPGIDVRGYKQVIIDLRPQDKTLTEFVNQDEDRHIYIQYEGNLMADAGIVAYLQELKKNTKDNWTLRINYHLNKHNLEAIKELAPHYMFIEMCYTWDDLDVLLDASPSEVLVGGYIAFDMTTVYKVCNSRGAKVRLVANVAQSDTNSGKITNFFIRPEDVHWYNTWVNGIEFVDIDGYSDKQQQVFFDAYSHGSWNGNLQEIISELVIPIDNQLLPLEFGERRLNCKKRCVSGGSCSLCTRYLQTANLIHEVIDKQKEDDKDGDNMGEL